MAPKRAQSPKGKAGRPAKAARVAAAAPAQEESRYPAMDVLLAELRASVPGHCTGMLAAMLPHALETPEQDRHGLQRSVLEKLAEVCAGEGGRREAAIAELEARIGALGGEREQAAAKLSAAQAEEEARRGAKDAAEAAVAAGSAAADAAAAALKQAQGTAEEAEAAVAAAVGEKKDFDDKVQELLTPLKEGSFAKKDWRLRQKAITQLLALFTATAAPESLLAALPLALKDGPEARSPFAVLAVQEGESLLKARSEQLEAAVVAAQGQAEEQRAAAGRAEAAAGEAAGARDAAMQESVERENAWVEAEEARRLAALTVDGFPEEAARLDAELAAAKTSLQQLAAAVEGFRQLASPPAPAVVEEPAEVVVPPAAESTAEPEAAAEAEVPAAALPVLEELPAVAAC